MASNKIKYMIFSLGLLSGAVFAGPSGWYMRATESHSGTTIAPPRILLGEKYKITINFPSAAWAETNYWIDGKSCTEGATKLNQQNGYVVPELIDLRPHDGPLLELDSSSEEEIGTTVIGGKKHRIFTIYRNRASVSCNSFLTGAYKPGKVQKHGFFGPREITYVVKETGRIGSGNVSFPNSSGGFYFFITRWEDFMSRDIVNARIINDQYIYMGNVLDVRLSWNTTQYCNVSDVGQKIIDFGTMTPSEIDGKTKKVGIELSCKGGDKTIVKVDLFHNNMPVSDELIPLSNGLSLLVSTDAKDGSVTVPADGSITLGITAMLKGNKPTEAGKFESSMIARITFL